MDKQEERAVEMLWELGSRPAAPFFEHGPARFIGETLAELGLRPRIDLYGNIVAHYRGRTTPPRPPIAFVAHMDHPGFEVVEVSAGRAVARALGGVPVASLRRPTPVLVLLADGRRLPAKTAPYTGTPAPPTEGGAARMVELVLNTKEQLSPPLPAVFDLPDFVMEGDTVRMRAVDDLAGCAASLAALGRLVADKAAVDVYAVFTRAEEAGLYGARLIAEAGGLPRDAVVVSVEASAVIPGVAQGEGPVIRTGDALYTFDGGAEQVLVGARESLRKRDPGFKVQRHLMSGGGCEATAFALAGYRVTGVAFPLGNYHNATTFIQDPDGGVEAEFIKLPDYLGGVALLVEAARQAASGEESPARRRLGPVPEEVKARLRVGMKG